MVCVDGYDFEITVDTPDGTGEIVGWGGEDEYKTIPLGEVVVELDNGEITSYDPHSISELKTVVVLG